MYYLRNWFFVVYVIAPILSFAQGLDDVPVLTDVTVDAQVLIDHQASPNEYEYEYSVTNKAINTGKVWNIKLDVSTQSSLYPARFFPDDPHSTLYDGSTIDMVAASERLSPFSGKLGSKVVPINIRTPLGWSGAYNRDGTAGVSAMDNDDLILPGQQLGGIQIRSLHAPVLRDIEIVANWFYVSDDGDEIDPAVEQQIYEANQKIRFQTRTIGPSPFVVTANGVHWNIFSKNVSELLDLGWISDASLAEQIEQVVSAAYQLFLDKDPTEAKSLLSSLLPLLAQAADNSMRLEAKQLIKVNIDLLIENTPDTIIPVEPFFEVTPEYTELLVNDAYTLKVTVTNASQNFAPLENYQINVTCSFVSASGQPAGCSQLGLEPLIDPKSGSLLTDANGQVSVTATRPAEGEATFDIKILNGEVELGQAVVKWSGGPDLVIPLFVPPFIKSSPGEALFISDVTLNRGNASVADTVTRYYLSTTSPIDLEQAIFIGERNVMSLNTGEESSSVEMPFTIPDDLATGDYYLIACADAEDTEIEASELNNCSNTPLENFTVQALAVENTDQLPTINISDQQILEGDHGLTTVTLSVDLEFSHMESDITVDWSTVDGSALEGQDYNPDSGSLLFQANTAQLSRQIHLDVIGDTDVESDETFSVVLSSPNEFVTLGKQIGVVTVSNDAVTISCDNAFANPEILWPPNHKFRKVGILGVEDFSDTSVDISIDSILQDEYLDARGDGTTKADGKGLGQSYAKVRAERSGNEDGRVYFIGFTATNAVGGTCAGTVIVGVPHDKKDSPIDSGLRIDSTGQ